VWSWWQAGSVHQAPWPDADALAVAGAPAAGAPAAGAPDDDDAAEAEDVALGMAADVLREVRKAKSQARLPMRAPVKRVLVSDTAERLLALALGEDDLLQAGAIERLERLEGEEFAVQVELAEEPAE
jgi:valyl-tRNA synthetase